MHNPKQKTWYQALNVLNDKIMEACSKTQALDKLHLGRVDTKASIDHPWYFLYNLKNLM